MRKRTPYELIFSFSVYLMLTCLISTNTLSQTVENQLSKDSHGNAMLIGKCTRAALLQTPFTDWFDPTYASYKLDSVSCNSIKPLLADKSITIFLGTWCDDSKIQVPGILKILDFCSFDNAKLTLIMVSNKDNEYKKSPQHEEEGRNIVRVPTIIIQENDLSNNKAGQGKEMGRIIECPVVSLEKDLLVILSRGNYIPNYHNEKIDTP
jgi:hypothetical protein